MKYKLFRTFTLPPLISYTYLQETKYRMDTFNIVIKTPDFIRKDSEYMDYRLHKQYIYSKGLLTRISKVSKCTNT